jgi:hypothetical protein
VLSVPHSSTTTVHRSSPDCFETIDAHFTLQLARYDDATPRRPQVDTEITVACRMKLPDYPDYTGVFLGLTINEAQNLITRMQAMVELAAREGWRTA